MAVFRFSGEATPQQVGYALHSLLFDIIKAISPEEVWVSRTLRRLGFKARLISDDFSDAVYVVTCSWNVVIFKSREEYRRAVAEAYDELRKVGSCAEWFRKSDKPLALRELICGPYRSKSSSGWFEVGYLASNSTPDALLRFKTTAVIVDFRATTKRRLSSSYMLRLYMWYNALAKGRTTPELWTAALRRLSPSIYVESREVEEELRESVNSVYEQVRQKAEKCGSAWAVDRFFKSLRVVTLTQLLHRFHMPTDYICERNKCRPHGSEPRPGGHQ